MYIAYKKGKSSISLLFKSGMHASIRYTAKFVDKDRPGDTQNVLPIHGGLYVWGQ